MENLKLKNSLIKLPIYLPDATRGVVKGTDSMDLIHAKVEGVVVNTYHLQKFQDWNGSGMTTQAGAAAGIKRLPALALGKLKNFMNFNGLVVSDSGGWQVFSLIHRNGGHGNISDEGVVFSLGGEKEMFTPEKSIQTQFALESDIMICLDDFTSPNAFSSEIRASVERTILWAKKSKDEYTKILRERSIADSERPLLMAVIQGGLDKEARIYCAEKLMEIGFDGYGFGGYVVDENGELDLEISEFIADLIPNDKLKFALGVGTPYQIAICRQMGWDIFDCTLPSRDARHKRLYIFAHEPEKLDDLLRKETYGYIYINKSIYACDEGPIERNCDCYACKNYSRAYLHHLFKIHDTLAFRLATIHNLRHYTRLMRYLRGVEYGGRSGLPEAW